MISENCGRLLERRKKELTKSRGRDIIFTNNFREASEIGEDKEVDEDIILISYEKNENVKSYNIGEIEIVPILNMLINPFEVEKKIEYKLISEKELLKKIEKEGKELPTILYSDAIRIWKGWRSKDIIEITRCDGSTYYRQVSN